MKIYIPTYGRPHSQETWAGLPDTIKSITTLVVQAREEGKYTLHHRGHLTVLPPEIESIAPTRQWILDNAEDDKILMIDDDFRFSCRSPGMGTKLFPCLDIDIEDMIEILDTMLSEYSHVAVSARQGNNHVKESAKVVGRGTGFTGCRVSAVRDIARYDRMVVQEDLDFTLQLLRAGHPNLVLYSYAYNQSGSNTKGGCSSFRTMAVQKAAAERLAELHPGFVKVVQKKTKGSWGGQERTDVTVYWKKAFASSQELNK